MVDMQLAPPEDIFWRMARTDRTKELDGIWIKSCGRRFKVRRLGGRNQLRYDMALQRLRPNGMDAKDIDPLAFYDLTLKAFISGCMVDWEEGFTGPDGKPMPFTPENAEEVLSQCPLVYTELRTVAEAMDHYRPDIPKK